MSVLLINLKKLYSQQSPGAAGARKDQDRATGALFSQLFRIEQHIRGHEIRVQLFGAQHTRLPDFWLGSDNAANKPHQFTRNDTCVKLDFLATNDRLIELRDESLRGGVHLQGVRSGFSFDAANSRR